MAGLYRLLTYLETFEWDVHTLGLYGPVLTESLKTGGKNYDPTGTKIPIGTWPPPPNNPDNSSNNPNNPSKPSKVKPVPPLVTRAILGRYLSKIPFSSSSASSTSSSSADVNAVTPNDNGKHGQHGHGGQATDSSSHRPQSVNNSPNNPPNNPQSNGKEFIRGGGDRAGGAEGGVQSPGDGPNTGSADACAFNSPGLNLIDPINPEGTSSLSHTYTHTTHI